MADCYDALRAFPAFKELADDRIEWICERVEEQYFTAGEAIVAEGDEPKGFYIQVEGVALISRKSGTESLPLGRHEAPSFYGEVQIFSEEMVPITLTAINPIKAYLMQKDDFRDLLISSRPFEKLVFRTMGQRLRNLESFIRGREKVASLGTLSAGLAHELNNPAASLARTMDKIMPVIRILEEWNIEYGKSYKDDAHTDGWRELREKAYENITNSNISSREADEREEKLADWLEGYGVPEPWKWAPPLALSGIEIDEILPLQEVWKNHRLEHLRHQGVRWLALSCELYSMVHDGQNASKRISDLIGAVKSYSYMNKDARQKVDIHKGIEDTLLMLKSKWKYGIEIIRDYDENLPNIEVIGSELNQVWTNLLDNAIDAMDEKGVITIRTFKENQHVCVDIEDNGPGIPSNIQARVFEPFFTTKEPGKGTGLGLEISHRIIENRHHGSICLKSQPGSTCFHIRLPISSEG